MTVFVVFSPAGQFHAVFHIYDVENRILLISISHTFYLLEHTFICHDLMCTTQPTCTIMAFR